MAALIEVGEGERILTVAAAWKRLVCPLGLLALLVEGLDSAEEVERLTRFSSGTDFLWVSSSPWILEVVERLEEGS